MSEIELGAAELEVLKVLWDLGPAPVRDVLAELKRQGRDLAYTTVQTFLTRLEQKGCVRSDRSGHAFVYSPTVSRDVISRSRLRSLVDELFDGATGALVLHLVKNERLSAREIRELHDLIEKLDKGRRNPKS